jgi:hypothetical protein
VKFKNRNALIGDLNMERKSQVQESLWPIIEPDDRIPLPPAAWAAINVIALLMICLPFFIIVGGLAAGLWFANVMREIFEIHVAYGSLFPAILTNSLKLLMVVVTGRVAFVLVYCIPYLIREGRSGLDDYLRDYDPF